MPFHRTLVSFCQRARGGPVTLAYKRRIKADNLRLDQEQLSLSAALDTLYSSLTLPSAGRYVIPDEHLETAAIYYGGSSSSLSALLFSGNFDFVGMAVATAHSFFTRISTSNTATTTTTTTTTNINTTSTSPTSTPTPKGIYIYGSVGVGKSMLMDLFYSICANGLSLPDENIQYNPIQRRRKRYHFHEFMLNVHQRIHAYKAIHPRGDPMPPVAAELAKEARLLCFDEMQITDIADAMIIKRLLTTLLDLGVVIVTTSNRPPGGLYAGGINRSVFLPFIDTLSERMDVIEMGGTYDYRRDGDGLMASNSDAALIPLPPYLCPSIDIDTDTDTSNSPSSQEGLELWFSTGTGETRTETIPVAMGRYVQVERANDTCGWFNFDELCNRPLGAADYIAIAERFDLIIVENVPQLGGHIYNEARRFVILIDALYEAKTKLIIAADVPRYCLFLGFDAIVETSDGDEETAVEDNDNTLGLGEESFVVGEGGSSSSSSTTLIRTQDGAMEWSATGRVGVSLAQLSSVREASFSFLRAESRLAEMAAANWGRL